MRYADKPLRWIKIVKHTLPLWGGLIPKTLNLAKLNYYIQLFMSCRHVYFTTTLSLCCKIKIYQIYQANIKNMSVYQFFICTGPWFTYSQHLWIQRVWHNPHFPWDPWISLTHQMVKVRDESDVASPHIVNKGRVFYPSALSDIAFSSDLWLMTLCFFLVMCFWYWYFVLILCSKAHNDQSCEWE